MKFFFEYPLTTADNGAFLEPSNMMEFARVAESVGVSGIALTDHPAPSRKWLDNGGHNTLDPFVGLGFFAAPTTSLRLMTYLTVVPYRNPFLLAKSMTSVDVLSGGRTTFVLGTGYLRSEFAALNADFENRNAHFDEGIKVIRGLLSSPHEFHHEGEFYNGLGVTVSPPPVQRPYPPLWLGGNARIVRDRVAAWGDGWAPLTLGGAMMSKVSRTAAILDDGQFAAEIQEIRDGMAEAGRDPATLEVAAPGTTHITFDATSEEKLDHVGTLTDVGVTWTTVPLDRRSYQGALDSLEEFGRDVINKL